MNETLDEQSREALGRIQVMGIISQTCSHNLQRFLCVFLFVAGLLNTSPMMAQKSEGKVVEGRMHTIIYKTDGTHVEGYLQNSFPMAGFGFSRSYHIPSALDTEMIVKPQDKPFERSIKVINSEIDSMLTWFDKTPEDKLKWEPQTADFAYGGKNPIVEDHPSMLLVLFEGKHVKGYLSHHILYGFRYLFKMDDMPYAKVFLSEEHKFNERRRKTLLDTFYMYPEMEDVIKQLTKDKVAEDPFYIIRKLDDILSMQKSDD